MKKPFFWKQTDKSWASYSWHGMTIGGGGCGPTSGANIISPITGKKVTPKTTFKWLCKHGYILPGQGTYHSGISAMLKHWGIKFKQTYSDSEAYNSLKSGKWLLGCVGPSRWTYSGHFIVLYGLTKSGHVLVSDPYSSSDYCQKKGTWNEYARANKNNWIAIDPNQLSKDKKAKASKTVIMYVDCALANIRKGRGTKYGVKGKLKRGTKLKLYNYKNGWYKIKSGKYKGCFISKTRVTNLPPFVHDWKLLTEMNIRTGGTTKAEVIGKVKKGTVIKSSKRQGDWVYFPALKGWVRRISADRKKKYMKQVSTTK